MKYLTDNQDKIAKNNRHFGNPEFTRAFMEDMARSIAHDVQLTPLHGYEVQWILSRAIQLTLSEPQSHISATSIHETE